MVIEDISDEELARFLNITPEEGWLIFPGMAPERRAEYVRMASVAKQLSKDGVAHVPGGLVCGRRRSAKEGH